MSDDFKWRQRIGGEEEEDSWEEAENESQTVWSQIKGTDVGKVLFFGEARIFWKRRGSGVVRMSRLWRVRGNHEESFGDTCWLCVSRKAWLGWVCCEFFLVFSHSQNSQNPQCSQSSQSPTYSRWVSADSKRELRCGSLSQLVPEHKQTEPSAISLILNRTGTFPPKQFVQLWERCYIKDHLFRKNNQARQRQPCFQWCL